jgi:asparagine synthase (glutamine-hydrolysing)
LLAGPEDLAILEDVLSAFDEPFADASAIPTYLVSRMAKQHVKVVLSGDGGDELFAGYDRYLVDHRGRYRGILGDAGLGGGFRYLSNLLPEGTPGKNYLYNMSLPRMERYVDAISLFPSRALRDFLDPALASETEDPFNAPLMAGEGLVPLSRLQDLDLQTYLPGDILTKLDRMSMANSLEARVPLLDHPLVEFACGLPVRLQLKSGEMKYLLKQVLRGKVPTEVLTRPKQGFAVPLEAWFADRLPGFFRDHLGDGSRLATLGLRASAIQGLMEQYTRRRRQDHCRRLWGLVVLDKFLSNISKVSSL